VSAITQEKQPAPDPDGGISSPFRAEALRYRTNTQGPGGVVRIAPRWTTWTFYGLVAMVVAMVVASSIIEIERYVTGISVTDGQGRVVALIPASLSSEIARGRPVDLEDGKAEVVSSDTTVLYPSEVSKRYGVEVTVPSVAVTTSAATFGSAPGSVRILVESEPLIVALIPGLKTILGSDDT
jgi:hypothetical protein